MTLGQKLAGYRKLSGMTQQQLGERLSVSAQAISKWEKDLSEPALATMCKLASIYNVTVDELINLESEFSKKVVPINNLKEKQRVIKKKKRIDSKEAATKKSYSLSDKLQNQKKKKVLTFIIIIGLLFFVLLAQLCLQLY